VSLNHEDCPSWFLDAPLSSAASEGRCGQSSRSVDTIMDAAASAHEQSYGAGEHVDSGKVGKRARRNRTLTPSVRQRRDKRADAVYEVLQYASGILQFCTAPVAAASVHGPTSRGPRLITSMPVWADADSPIFQLACGSFTVLQMLRAGLKVWQHLAAEARSEMCTKSFLVHAGDPVLTVWKEFGVRCTDAAEAASLIVQRMHLLPGGVVLHGCETLYLHCKTAVVAAMIHPCRLISRSHVLTKLSEDPHSSRLPHFLQHSDLGRFTCVILGSHWQLPPVQNVSNTDVSLRESWPTMVGSKFSVVAGGGTVASLRVRDEVGE